MNSFARRFYFAVKTLLKIGKRLFVLIKNIKEYYCIFLVLSKYGRCHLRLKMNKDKKCDRLKTEGSSYIYIFWLGLLTMKHVEKHK